MEKFESINSILSLLYKQVEMYPNKTAVVDNDKDYSYSCLYEKIEFFSHKLIIDNVSKGDRVVVLLDKSISQYVTMFSVFLVGGVYVPIDPLLPKERIDTIIRECEPKLIINENYLKNYSTSSTKINGQLLLNNITKDDLAYILFTSGTSGKPKGVMISHGNIANKLIEEKKLLSIDNSTVTLTLTSLSFDVSFLETLLPVCFGGQLIIISTKSIQNIIETIEFIKRFGVTILQGTPTYFSHFVSFLTAQNNSDLNSLKDICIGGESLNSVLVKQIRVILPWVRVNNHYGPTEITIDAVSNYDIKDFEKNIIGKPFGNTVTFVLDENNKQVKINEIGELVIGGPSVFKGYWNNEALTNEKLKNVNFFKDKLYYTGDLVKLNTENEIEFLTRKDSQVKLRGYRIELEEIDQTMLQISGVTQSFCKVVDNVLINWSISSISKENIIETLRKSLPDYMIPSAFIFVEKMPTNINGKIDINQLPKYNDDKKNFKLPNTDIEKQIAKIWKDILGKDNISVHDNFYELGGHSLKHVLIKNRIENQFNVDIKYYPENNTVYQVSKLIEEINWIQKNLNVDSFI